MPCPICEKRKPERFCPAKGEKICAVCCGSEREKTIDCPADCAYLIAAKRYEAEHPRDLPPDTPLLDVTLPREVIEARQEFLAGVALAIAKYCAAQPAVTDPDVLAALQALAETYRTLGSGIFYENPPVAPAPRALYDELGKHLAEAKLHAAGNGPLGAIKDSEIFALLVFLYRMGLLRTNGRPRARRFIEFLRSQFPASEVLAPEPPRIIVP